jgi:hypothetical protein
MGCPCPNIVGPPNINSLRLGNIITIISTIFFFILLRVPLEHKLNSLKLELVKPKYGGSEEYFRFYRKHSKRKDKDIPLHR